MATTDILQILLVSLVLLVGLVDFYYSHINTPTSDILLDAEVSSRSEAKDIEGEFDYWLYFHANNRGDDNGYVTAAALKRIEFFDENNPDQIESVEGDDLKDGVYDAAPLVILQRETEEDGNERGALLIAEGDVEEILVVLRVFSGEVIPLAREYDRTRAVLEFEMVDSERKYTTVTESEAVNTHQLVPSWAGKEYAQ